MYDYSYVLELLRVQAVDHRSRALLGQQEKVKNLTTERALRNRAQALCLRLFDIPERQRHQFIERAVRRL
jgi:hypothetical protein